MNKLITAVLLLIAFDSEAAIQYVVGEAGQVHVICLSSDTKPSIANGSSLLETDTAKIYLRTGGSWVESTNVAYLAAASYTAADVLAKLLTVDGAGSTLDADLLDGSSSAAFQPADSDLTSIAALSTTAHGRGLLDDADAAASRASLSLGSAATSATTDFGPAGVDYLVGTANGTLSGEIVAGTSPGGELGNTWGSPTLDDGVTVDGWALGASTATTAAANDNDTSLATTAFVQSEIDDGDNLTDNCILENDSTPIPDSCVGDGSDAGGSYTFNSDGDNNSPQTISSGDELLIAGGTNGVDTVSSATDTVTINLDLSESAAGGELGGNLDAPTLDDNVSVVGWTIDEINLDAGSASAGTWPTLTSGTLLTTAEDGAIEEDSNAFYATTDAGNRGNVPVEYIIRADATRTFASNTNQQAIFDSPTNGRLTLETGTYLFDGVIAMTSMSGTSGNGKFSIIGAGTATLGSILWWTSAGDVAAETTGGAGGGQWHVIATQTAANIATAQTVTALAFSVNGTFEVTGAGTIIPSFAQTTAAAAVVSIGSYLKFRRIGDTSLTNIGQWD